MGREVLIIIIQLYYVIGTNFLFNNIYLSSFYHLINIYCLNLDIELNALPLT